MAAMILTALLLLQLLWGVGRLVFLSEPEPVLPADAVLLASYVKHREPAPEAREIVDRPLFWRGRKAFAYEPPADVVEENPAQPGSANIQKVKLLGAYSGATPGVIVAFNGKRQRVSINESLEGWTLRSVNANQAVFENGDSSHTVDLQHASPTASLAPQKPERRRKTAVSGGAKKAKAETDE